MIFLSCVITTIARQNERLRQRSGHIIRPENAAECDCLQIFYRPESTEFSIAAHFHEIVCNRAKGVRARRYKLPKDRRPAAHIAALLRSARKTACSRRNSSLP